MPLENERSVCGKQDDSYQVVSGIPFVSFLYIYGIDIFPSEVDYVCEKLRCLQCCISQIEEGEFLYATLFFVKNLFIRISRLIETVESLTKFTLAIYLTLCRVT